MKSAGVVLLLGLAFPGQALASDIDGVEDEPGVEVDVSAGVTAFRSGATRDASGPGLHDVDLRRAVPGGVIAIGAQGPRRRGAELFVAITGAFREPQVTGPPLFGTPTFRPTRAVLGLGPRGGLRAGIDGAIGPRAVDFFGSVGPIVGLGTTTADEWRPALPAHLRLGVHASIAASTPIGSGVELHMGWRSLVLADVAGSSQRRVDPWHLGLFTLGVRVPVTRDRSP